MKRDFTLHHHLYVIETLVDSTYRYEYDESLMEGLAAAPGHAGRFKNLGLTARPSIRHS
jgi:hypothetical protein